jgi:hypothetical protein
MKEPIFRAEDVTVPRTHVLVIGVNDYPHLSGGHLKVVQMLPAYKQLSSPLPSAQRFANWMLSPAYQNPRAPLGSVRCLLSKGKFTATDGTEKETDLPTRDDLRKTRDAWLKDCNQHPDNIAMLYYCGHGFSVGNTYLLLEDTGDSEFTPWENIINFSSTFANMNSCVARTQCFFVDACQTEPGDAVRVASTKKDAIGFPLIATLDGPAKNRDAQVFVASQVGNPAYGRENKVSFFTEALIRCLETYGADANLGRSPWRVTNDSLKRAMNHYLSRQTAGEVQLDPFAHGESTAALGVLQSIQAPRSFVTVNVTPEPAPHADLVLDGPGGKTEIPNGGIPWKSEMAAGNYRVKATGYVAKEPEEYVAPPFQDLNIQLTAVV